MGNLFPNQRYSMEFKYALALRFGFWIETADDLVTLATMLAALKKALQNILLGTNLVIILLLVGLNLFSKLLIYGLFTLTSTKLLSTIMLNLVGYLRERVFFYSVPFQVCDLVKRLDVTS